MPGRLMRSKQPLLIAAFVDILCCFDLNPLMVYFDSQTIQAGFQ